MPDANGEWEVWNPSDEVVSDECPTAVEEVAVQAPLDIPDLPQCALSQGPLPKVGSPEWCSCLDQLVNWVTELGQSAFDFLFPNPSADATEDWLSAAIAALNPTNSALKAAVGIASTMSDEFRGKVQAVYDTIRGMMDKGRVCNPAAIAGVEIARALVNALNRVRLGTDALVWATLDLRFAVSVLHRILTYVEGYVCPVEIPSYGEVLGCYIANSAPEGLLRCWSAMQGHDWDVNEPTRRALRRKPELQELFTLRNRETIDELGLQRGLRNLGFTDQVEAFRLKDLRFEVPGPSDLVRFAVRHVFEPELIQRQGYNLEFDQLAGGLDPFHHAVGLDYPIFTGPTRNVVEAVTGKSGEELAAAYAKVGLPEPTWARAYWWSHYVTISPTQAYEAFFRLDPARDKTGEPDWMQSLNFTLDDLRLQLRVNDYAPPMRDILAAIAFRPPNLRFLRVQLATKTINRAGAVSQLRQMGFRPDYAEIQAAALEQQIAQQEAEKLLKIVLPQLEAAWEIGLTDDQQFVEFAVSAGVPTEEAEAHLHAATVKRDVAIAKRLVAVLRAAFLRGRFKWEQVSVFLDQIGINQRRKDEYQTEWTAEKQSRQKEATVGQLVKAVIDNGLSIADFAQRLRNLDYTDDAIEVILADVRYRVTQAQARALRSLAAEQDRTQRSRLSAIRAADRMLKEQRAEASRHGTPGQLKTWFCNGDIAASDVTERLKFLNWPQEDIDRLLGECDARRAKAGLAPYSQEATGSEA